MNKAQRIYFETGNTSTTNHIKVQLEQNVDTIEFLSMSVSTKDVYRDFNADYGVLVGRVVANGGVGIPNAKISIFIPLSDTDAENTEISSYYPYKTPRDKNNDGKRYNLLPRVARPDPKTGVISPKQPFGSFPIKEETLINKPFLDVYKKYYKYTALTNGSGDYMIFGVPIGTQTVHLSVDITDIGKFSMNPAAMVTNLGYSPNLFMDNGSKIKPSSDLNDLPNIETQEISVDIIPFWGDSENFDIGITRQDFRIRSVLVNTFVIFGNAFTDSNETVWGKDTNDGRKINELNRIKDNGWLNPSISTKRIGKITEKIYYYPVNISDADINDGIVNPKTQMQVLDKTQYSAYKRDGDFVFIINCNRNKVVTDEFGNEVPVDDNSSIGVFTKFRGFVVLEITLEDIPAAATTNIGNDTSVLAVRFKLKFPQYADRNKTFTKEDSSTQITDTETWRKQCFTFETSKYYSFARFHGTTFAAENAGNDNAWEDSQMGASDGFWNKDYINYATYNHFWNSGIILTNNMGADYLDNDEYEFPHNAKQQNNYNVFGAQWLNLSIYLPHTAFLKDGYSHISRIRGLTNFTKQLKDLGALNNYYFYDNTQAIAAGDFNTKWFARSDLQWTDIIEVPIGDIILMKSIIPKGFTSNVSSDLTGKYRNGYYIPSGWTGACPINGGKIDGIPTNSEDLKTYFYKGLSGSDCIEYLYLLGIIST